MWTTVTTVYETLDSQWERIIKRIEKLKLYSANKQYKQAKKLRIYNNVMLPHSIKLICCAKKNKQSVTFFSSILSVRGKFLHNDFLVVRNWANLKKHGRDIENAKTRLPMLWAVVQRKFSILTVQTKLCCFIDVELAHTNATANEKLNSRWELESRLMFIHLLPLPCLCNIFTVRLILYYKFTRA